MKTYIVCYSGGHSSALVAIETVRKYGKENVILLNHDIAPNVEDKDIKRFKIEVADYLGLKITYANMKGWESLDQFDVSIKNKAFMVDRDKVICTSHMKSKPFHAWLKKNYPVKEGQVRDDVVLLYGFDSNEHNRINRRSQVLGKMGYKTDYPLALWNRTIEKTEEIGILKPKTYDIWKHANCTGCIKAGKQHWYIVYCMRKDIWEKGKAAEKQIGYSILKNSYLSELESEFEEMQSIGIIPTEKVAFQSYWASVRKRIANKNNADLFDHIPCNCTD